MEPGSKILEWPLKNVWVGTSVEDQKRADERIQILLQVPATVRFLSMEPLLGEVKLPAIMKKADWRELHWVIVGGESGPGARPMHPNWARTIRDDCARHGVAFFFKQVDSNSWVNDRQAKEFLSVVGRVSSQRVHVSDQGLLRGSKKSGGRLLDRKLHEQMPVVSSRTPRKS